MEKKLNKNSESFGIIDKGILKGTDRKESNNDDITKTKTNLSIYQN